MAYRCLVFVLLSLHFSAVFGATTVTLQGFGQEPYLGGVDRAFDADSGDTINATSPMAGDRYAAIAVDAFEFRFFGKDGQLPFVGLNSKAAISASGDDERPGLEITAVGECDSATGQFDVHELDVDGSFNVNVFAVDFIVTCEDEGSEGFLVGEIRFESDIGLVDGDGDGFIDVADLCPALAETPEEVRLDSDQDGIGDACDSNDSVTLINFVSEPGDSIGQGQTLLFTDDEIELIGRNFGGGVELEAGGYQFEFGPASGEPFALGRYDYATRHAFIQGSAAGVDIGGNGRGCNKIRARFNLLEFVVDDVGDVERLAIDFEQYCRTSFEGDRLYGNIRWRSDIDDATNFDTDGDGVTNLDDLCPGVAGGARATDSDGDMLGNSCDPYPNDSDNVEACLAEFEEVDEFALRIEGEADALSASLVEVESEIETLVEAQASLEAEAALIDDTDLDGVSDIIDICPDSLATESVDGEGCSQSQACGRVAVDSFADFKACNRFVFVNTIRACRAERSEGGFACVSQ